MTLDGTWSWIVGGTRPVLLDPGPEDEAHLERIVRAVGPEGISAVALTHAHADHAAGAAAAAERFDAPIRASAETLRRTGLDGEPLEDGERLPLAPGELAALASPGHSADGFAFLALPERWLFSGDLVLGAGSSAVLHPDGRVADCLASLARLASLRPKLLFPGHGPAGVDAEERIATYRAHRLERDERVEEAVREGAASFEEIRRRAYGEVPDGLRAAADASLAAHLVHLEERGVPLPVLGPLPELDEETA
jgi:glyoxylase-like metal-dependent hydrolase (beta-lactamase superfamily II)